MEILAKLFGSNDRVRIIRYCLVKINDSYDIKTAATDLKIDTITVRRELKLLSSVGFIKECVYTKESTKERRGKIQVEKSRVDGYKIDSKFPYLINFKSLFQGKEDLAPLEIFEHFRKLGKIELFIVSGVFCVTNTRGGVDLLIVGSALKRSKIEEQIKEIEESIGTELNYAIFDTQEFMYRYMMHDKFVREILHAEHTEVFNTLDLR